MSKRKKEYATDVLKREIEERKMKLKRCPFCGGKAIVAEHKFGFNDVYCESCGARTTAWYQNVPLKEMLRKYDCSKSCFFDFLRNKGISPNKNKKRDMLLQNIENIRMDLKNGMIRKDVQKKYNCSKSTLERLIKNYNLRDYAIAN